MCCGTWNRPWPATRPRLSSALRPPPVRWPPSSPPAARPWLFRRARPVAGPGSRYSAVSAAASASGAGPGRRPSHAPPCGKAKPVAVRTAAGEPLCEMCRMGGQVRPRTPGVRDVRQDRSDRGPGPRRARRRLRELLPDAGSNLRRVLAGCRFYRATSPRLPGRSARPARRRRPPPAPAAARTARPRPAGPKDRSATRATPPRCGTGHHAHPAGRSGGWSPRPARPLTPAPAAPGSPSPAPAPTAGSRTSSSSAAGASAAACGAGPRRCWPGPAARSRPG